MRTSHHGPLNIQPCVLVRTSYVLTQLRIDILGIGLAYAATAKLSFESLPSNTTTYFVITSPFGWSTSAFVKNNQ